MSKSQSQWSLEDVVDFEQLAFEVQGEAGLVPEAESREVRRVLREEGKGLDPVAKRRLGLRAWLDGRRAERGFVSRGRQVMGASQVMGFVLLVLLVLSGIGVVRALLMPFEWESALGKQGARGFNIWIFLAVTLGLQWLVLLGSGLVYLLVRRWTGGLDWVSRLLGSVLRRAGGKVAEDEWQRLLQGRKGGKSALAWRLVRVLQLGGIGYNAGLMAGLFGCLWFLQVGFFWESTLPQFGEESLRQTSKVIGAPFAAVSSVDAEMVRAAKLGFVFPEGKRELAGGELAGGELAGGELVDLRWAEFFFGALFVWGMLPRVLLWAWAMWGERRALASLDFQEREHRELWRRLTKLEHEVVSEGANDGVVLLDVGGTGVETAWLRPFLLQVMRVNPVDRYEVGILDLAREAEAWGAVKKSPNGVILLVDGWDLSPKAQWGLWSRLREAVGSEVPIRYLVLGTAVDGEIDSVGEVELGQWKNFVDELRDAQCEVVAYDRKQVLAK